MKKICVFSDVHYGTGNYLKMLEEAKDADALFFLGDGLENVMRYIPEEMRTKLHAVEGNCDTLYQHDEYLEIEGKKIMLTHGNKYGVKYDMLNLQYKAEEEGVDIVCFGHTHRFYNDTVYGVTYLNPGSVGTTGSYAMLIIENGEIFVVPRVVS